MVLSWSDGCTSCHCQVGSGYTRMYKAGPQRSGSFLRQPGFLQWCGRDPWLSARASQRGWLFGNRYYGAMLSPLTSELGEVLTTDSKVHSNWNTKLSLKQSTLCGPQMPQNIQAQRGGMPRMVKRMDVVRSVNASDTLSRIAGRGVWENT